ncbi:MAG: adenylate kinase [Victivallales bacterium]|nr:adenylate kinase [Victivallales bacterium]
MLNKHNLVFLGPPGAGKGTIAQLLARDSGLVHISTGDIFRNEIGSGTELGKKARGYVDSGGLVPDDLVSEMVGARLSRPDCTPGFILDGFPRTLNQAGLLKPALCRIGKKLDCVVNFEAPYDLLVKRLTARIICSKCVTNYNRLFSPPQKDGVCDLCQGALYSRPDDSLDTAIDRLRVYKEQTEPLIEYYRDEGILVSVDGSQSKEITYPMVLEVLR